MYVTLLFISLSANHNTDVIWQEKIKHQAGSGFSFLSKIHLKILGERDKENLNCIFYAICFSNRKKNNFMLTGSTIGEFLRPALTAIIFGGKCKPWTCRCVVAYKKFLMLSQPTKEVLKLQEGILCLSLFQIL